MMVKFQIIKVEQPNCFLGKDLELFASVSSSCQELRHSNSKILPCSEVVIQKIYLANLITEIVRIRVLQSINSNTFRCLLIDHGRIEEIRKQKIYNIPLNKLDMDPAVKMIKIPGIRPAGMNDVLSGPMITVHLSESDKWMPASFKFVSRIFEENSVIHVKYLKQVSKDKMFVDVLVNYLNQRENLKNLLVTQGYAFISKEHEIEIMENHLNHIHINENGIQGDNKSTNDKYDSASIDSLENESISIVIENMKGDDQMNDMNSNEPNTVYQLNQWKTSENSSVNQSIHGTLDELSLDILNLKVKCWTVQKCRTENGATDFNYLGAVRPILSYKNDKLLATFLKEAMAKYDTKFLLIIQSYMIPNILRGFNTLALAPPRKGKSMGLLMPVLQTIATKQLLPSRSYNPLAIILCSSWKKVKDLAEAAEKFTRFIKDSEKVRKPRIVAAYNGSLKKMTMIPVLQGCDVLIITPNCLLNWLKQHEFFKLNELEVFCLDDAENIIAEHLETLQEILIYKRTGAIDRGSEPSQYITATVWTSRLESYVKYEMGDKFSIAVNDPLELAVIERVKQKIIEYEDIEGDLYQKLVAYLELTESSIKRTIIFASTDDEILLVYKYLMQKASVDLKMMTGSMSPEELNLMVKEWNQYRGYVNMPILLISDEALRCSDILIYNAEIILHVDVCETSFGNRLNFLRDKYSKLSFLKSRQDANEKCHSFIFICPTTLNLRAANFLHRFLGRCGSDRPEWLKERSIDFILNKEKSKGSNEICPRIKSFGECKLPGCVKRHMVLSDIDKPLLPNKGHIQFRLLYLVSPSHFFVRINEFSSNSESEFSYNSQYLSLKMKMANYFNNQLNIHGVDLRLVHVGLIAAIKIKDLLERVVVSKMKSNQTGYVQVKLIDKGSEMIVEQADLLQLPRELSEIPPQAIECYVTGIRPIDNDEIYSEESCLFTNTFLEEKDLYAIIRLCIGSTLWVDSVTQRIHHAQTRVTVFDKNLAVTLLDKNLVDKNRQHIEKLIRLCTGKIDIWKPSIEESSMKPVPIMRKFTYTNSPIVFETLPVLDDDNQLQTECVFTHIFSPSLIIFNNKATIKSLRDLQIEIDSLIDSIEALSISDIKIGSKVLFYRDQCWHRGYVIKINSNVTIFSLDEGLIEIYDHSREPLKKLPNEYQQIPYQAILCNLSLCSHFNNSYSDDVIAAIKHYVIGTDKNTCLIISVYKEENVDRKMFNDSEIFSQLIDDELFQFMKRYSVTVSKPGAKPSDNMLHNVLIRNQNILPSLSWIHDVLPESKPFSSRLERNGSIPHLSADILSTKDGSKRLRISQTIERIIDNKINNYETIGSINEYMASFIHGLSILIHFMNEKSEFMCIYRSLNRLLSLAYKTLLMTNFENENETFTIKSITELILSYESFIFHMLRHLEITARTHPIDNCHIILDNLRMILLDSLTVKVLFQEPSWYAVMATCVASLQNDHNLYNLLIDILVQLVMLWGSNKPLLEDILIQCCLSLQKSDSPIIWTASLAVISCFVNMQNYSSIFRNIKFFDILFDKFVSYYEQIDRWEEFHENALDILSNMWRNGSANSREILRRRTLSADIEVVCRKNPRNTTLSRLLTEILREESFNSSHVDLIRVPTISKNAPDKDAIDWIEGREFIAKKHRSSYKRIYYGSDTESSSNDHSNSETDSDSSDVAATPFLNDMNPADEDNVLCFEKP